MVCEVVEKSGYLATIPSLLLLGTVVGKQVSVIYIKKSLSFIINKTITLCTNSVKTDWKEALVYSNYLLEGSRWSRTMYSYQKAALMIMQDEELSNTDRVVVHNLMK